MNIQVHPRQLVKLIVLPATVLLLLLAACVPVYAGKPHISSLEASTLYVYPQGKTELTCFAASPNGSELSYDWNCTEGNFTGSGSTVTWKAPNKYGKFHIVVKVSDGKGNSDVKSITITSVVNENPEPQCKSCK